MVHNQVINGTARGKGWHPGRNGTFQARQCMASREDLGEFENFDPQDKP